MGDARYIGRVGALAVALGIGTAVITTPGIAWADGDTDTPSETVNDSTSGDVNNGEGNAPTESHVGNAPTTDDGDPDEQESGGATTISVGGGPEVIISVQTNTDDNTETPPTGDTTPPAPPAPTPPVSTPPVQSSTAPAPPPVQNAPTEQLPVPTVDPPVDPNPVPGPEQGSDTVTTLHQQPDNSTLTQAQDTPQDTSFANARMFAFATVADDPPPPAAFVTVQDTSLAAAQDPVQALMAFPATVLNIAAGFVTALLAPFLAPSPLAPAQPPLALFAVLDWVRREIQRTFFNRSPNAAANVFTTSEDDDLSGNVLGNDTDADGDPLTATLVTGPAHGDVALNADGSFTYTPDANYNGTDTFTYKASDETGGWHLHGLFGLFSPDGGHTDTATVTINITAVNDAPVSVDDTATIAEDTHASGNVLANDTDIDSAPLAAALGTGPAHGVAVVNANGTYTYTPDADFNGVDTFTYTVSDGTAADTGTVTVTVTPVQDAPVAVNDTATVAEDSGASVIDVSANDTDVDGDDLDITSVTQPANGTVVNNGDGTVSYTPGTNFTGTDTFSYTVSDGIANDTATVTVTVTAVNDAPVAVNDELATTEDTALNFTPADLLGNDSDVDGDALVTVVQSPSNGSLTVHGDGSYTYTPNANFHGTDTFSYVANDGTASSNIATVTVTVSSVNDAPVAQPDAVYGPEDFPEFSDNVLSNDSDPDGDTLTAQLVSGPANGSAFNLDSNGTFTYTPSANFVGEDTFTYRASDGTTTSALTTVHIFVGPSNDDVVARDDTNTTPANTHVGGNVLTNDVAQNPDGPTEPLTVTTTAPITTTGGGSVTIASDGSYAYNPATGFTGVDTFDYTVTDGLTSDTGQVSITVTEAGANIPPVANDDELSTAAGTPLTIMRDDLFGNDVDPDGDPAQLTGMLIDQPSHGTLGPDAMGNLVYTPNAGYTGTDTFTYQLNDGQDLSNIATVTITVGDTVANIPPIANDDALSTDVDTPLTIPFADVIDNDDDPDGDVSQTTGAIIDQPSHGTLGPDAMGNLVYTPNAGYTGTDTFTYQLNDGQDLSNIATVTITVGDVVTNTPPVPGYDSLSTNTDTPLTFGPEDLLANDYDAEGDPLSVDVFDEPINGTLVLNGNGSYTYTPTAGYTGPDQFSYYANDGTDESAYYAVVTINVGLPADTAPIATDDTLTTDADTPLTITYDDLVGNDTDADGDGLDPYIVSDPAHGTLEDNGDGTYTYTPDAGYTGTDTFHYTAYDGYADSTPATVTITVNPVDEAPSLIENVGSNPYELTIVGDRLYVTNGGGTTVTVIDLTTNTEIDTDATAPGTQPITVGQQPFGMAIRGNRLYVVNRGDDTVSVIDLNTNTVIDTDDTTPGVQPINVGDEPSYAVVVGNRLYVSAEFDNAVTVIDLDTNTVIDTDTVTPGTQSIDVGGQPFAMTLVLNRFLLVGNYGGDTVAVFDTDTNTFVDIDPSTPGTQPISGGGLNAPHGLAFAGTNVYIGNDDGTVSVFDASTNAFVDTDPGTPGAQPINAGTGRLTGMVVNGNRLYVANTGANQVVVIDIETNAVVDTIPVGHAPWGLALDGNLLYVANYFDDTVSVIDITPPSVIV